MLDIIKETSNIDIYIILLYKSMVRSQLDYCSSVWSPYKVLPELKDKSYIERLKCVINGLPTLHFRRSW